MFCPYDRLQLLYADRESELLTCKHGHLWDTFHSSEGIVLTQRILQTASYSTNITYPTEGVNYGLDYV